MNTPILTLLFGSLLMIDVRAELIAAVESEPITDPDAAFHRFDVFLSNTDNHAISVETLGDDNWFIGGEHTLFGPPTAPLLPGEDASTRPRFIDYRDVPTYQGSKPERSIRATYEIARPKDGWFGYGRHELGLGLGTQSVEDEVGNNLRGSIYPFDNVVVRIPAPYQIAYNLIESGIPDVANPTPITLRYEIVANFVLSPSSLIDRTPITGVREILALSVERLDVISVQDGKSMEVTYRVSPDPVHGWGRSQKIFLPQDHPAPGPVDQIEAAGIPVSQPDQIQATVNADPIDDPAVLTHTFQVTWESRGAAIDDASVSNIWYRLDGGFEFLITLLGDPIRLYSEELWKEAALIDSVTEEDGRRITKTFEMARPASGWRNASNTAFVFLSARHRYPPESTPVLKTVDGTISHLPELIGNIPLAYAAQIAALRVDFDTWSEDLRRSMGLGPGQQAQVSGDHDGDGAEDLLEYALGTAADDPEDIATLEASFAIERDAQHVQLGYSQGLLSKEVAISVQGSIDGREWEDVRGHFRLLETSELQFGQRAITLRSIATKNEISWRLFRLVARLSPSSEETN